MSALSITASAVIPAIDAKTSSGIAGETVTAGQILYYKTTDSRWWKADATTLEKSGSASSGFVKMCLNGASAGQPVTLFEADQDITINSVLTQGVPYFLSAASAGSMVPFGDLVSTNFHTQLGYAKSATVFRFHPQSTGIQIP